jgi:choice-of-anchor A domain-containing protein
MYKEGAYELQDNVTINGTLVVEGDLLIKGTNISINPQPGFPALVVTGNVEIYQQGKSLTSNGVTYIGGQLKSNGSPLLPALASTFTVNGGLIFGSPTVQPIMTGYNVKTSLTYNAAKASAPELSSALRTTKGVTIVRWGLP